MSGRPCRLGECLLALLQPLGQALVAQAYGDDQFRRLAAEVDRVLGGAVEEIAVLVLEPKGVDGDEVRVAEPFDEADGPEFLEALALEVDDLERDFDVAGAFGDPDGAVSAGPERADDLVAGNRLVADRILTHHGPPRRRPLRPSASAAVNAAGSSSSIVFRQHTLFRGRLATRCRKRSGPAAAAGPAL